MDAINYILGPDYDKKVNEYASEMAKLYDNKTVMKKFKKGGVTTPTDAYKKFQEALNERINAVNFNPDKDIIFDILEEVLKLARKYHTHDMKVGYSVMIDAAVELIEGMRISEKSEE